MAAIEQLAATTTKRIFTTDYYNNNNNWPRRSMQRYWSDEPRRLTEAQQQRQQSPPPQLERDRRRVQRHSWMNDNNNNNNNNNIPNSHFEVEVTRTKITTRRRSRSRSEQRPDRRRRRRRRRSYSDEHDIEEGEQDDRSPPRKRRRRHERNWSRTTTTPPRERSQQEVQGRNRSTRRQDREQRIQGNSSPQRPLYSTSATSESSTSPPPPRRQRQQRRQRYSERSGRGDSRRRQQLMRQRRRRGERQLSWGDDDNNKSDSRERNNHDRWTHRRQRRYSRSRQRHASPPYHRGLRYEGDHAQDRYEPQNHRNHHEAAVPMQPPRAGVVSVEDDAIPYSNSQQQQQQQDQLQRKEGGIRYRSAPSPRPSQPDNHHHETKRSASDDNGSQGDSAGHFQGGPGTIIADRYKIIQDLGIGTFGRVVECRDLRLRTNRMNNNITTNFSSRRQRGSSSSPQMPPQQDYPHRSDDRVAIKIVRNVKKKKYYESALIEAGIVGDVNRRGGRGVSHCAILWESFTFNGHFCMVFESLGLSLYDFLKRHNYQPFPMICLRDFAQQLLEALEFLHSFQLIHTDLKPENILLTGLQEVTYRGYRVPQSTRIKVIDFGGATYDHERKSSVVNTRQYRSPEVILGVGWSMPSDLWSAGCILAELYGGELLFATHDNIEHLALIERIIGPFPRWMIKRAKNTQLAHESFSSSSGRHRGSDVLSAESAQYVKRMVPLESMIRRQDELFLHLLRRILVIDPNERSTARECLQYRL